MIINSYGEYTIQHIFVDRVKSGKIEYFNDLYNKYYYIVDKFCKKYDGELKNRAVLIAEDILKNAILEFCEKQEVGCTYYISSFIYNKFQSFDNKVVKLPPLKNIEQRAYNNDHQARLEILRRYKNTINKYINIFIDSIYELYEQRMQHLDDYSYLDEDFEFPEYIINEQDVIQDYYTYTWRVLSEYYNSKTIKCTFTQCLHSYLKHYTKKRVKDFNTSFNNFSENLENQTVPDFLQAQQLERIEDKHMLEALKCMLNDKEKTVCDGVYSGLTYEEIGKQLGTSRQHAHLIMKRIGKKVKY